MLKTEEFKDLFQSADWTKEKHVPVIESEDRVKKGEPFRIGVVIGKEIPHPNTTEHHIEWAELYFLPDGDKYPHRLGCIEFGAHGASIEGPNTSTVYTAFQGTIFAKTDKPGMLYASSYCNIHGLWKSEKRIELVDAG